jgi:hypothetical protein
VGFFAQSVATLIWAFQIGIVPLVVVCFSFWWAREEKPFTMDEEIPLDAELVD